MHYAALTPLPQLLLQREAVKVEGNAWPSYKLKWDLPPGVTPERLIERHSAPNLLLRLSENLPRQMFRHRGAFNYGKLIQEDSFTAMKLALGPGKGNLMETDGAITKDGVPVILHEFNPWRVALLPDARIQQQHSKDVIHAPMIVREIDGGSHTERYLITRDKLPGVEEFLNTILKLNPSATIFFDTREDETAFFVAWFSKRPMYHQSIVLLFYSFRYPDGKYLADAIEEEGAPANWRKTVALCPAMFPDQFCKLAIGKHYAKQGEDALYTRAKWWLDSMLKQGMRIVAVLIMLSRVKRSDIKDRTNELVVNAFEAEFAAERLANYVKKDRQVRALYPNLKLASATRAYVFSSIIDNERVFFGINMFTGQPTRWEDDERQLIRKGYATAGNRLADWTISDAPEDDMAADAWEDYGSPRQLGFDAPQFDLRVLDPREIM